jgi:hypothetical protein
LYFRHTKLHGKQISKTEERALVMSAYFLILQNSEAFAVCKYANRGVKELQWGPPGGWGGVLETRPGFRLTACKN